MSDLIRTLWSGIPEGDDFKTVSEKVLSAEGKSLSEQLRILTEVERTPGLPVAVFGLVAATKRALVSGKQEHIDDVQQRAWRLLGQI